MVTILLLKQVCAENIFYYFPGAEVFILVMTQQIDRKSKCLKCALQNMNNAILENRSLYRKEEIDIQLFVTATQA